MTKRELSHSQKDVYRACKKKWYYQYAEKKGTDEKSEALLLGEYTHSLIERYLRAKQITVENNHYIDTGYVTKMALNDDTPELSQDNIKLALTLAVKALLTLQKDCKKIIVFRGQPAIELKLTVDGFYTGVIDLLYVDKQGKVVLLDWKTTSYMNYYTNHRVKTASQLIGYAWLLEQHGVKVDKLAYGVLSKRDKFVELKKVNHRGDYTTFLSETHRVHNNIIDVLGVHRGNPHQVFFLDNAESCFNYNTCCPFYDTCWGEDIRKVETVTLVPTLL